MTQEELLDRIAVMADQIVVQAAEKPVKEFRIVLGSVEGIQDYEDTVNAQLLDGWQPYGFAWEQAGTIKLVMVKR